MDTWWQEMLVILAFVVGFSVLIIAVVWALLHEPKSKIDRLYAAWCRANPNIKISREDFEILRDDELLPGQLKTEPNYSSGYVSGLTMGMAMSKR